VDFAKGQRKDDIAHEHLAGFTGSEGVLFVGRAQEKTKLFRTEKRRDANGDPYPWIVPATGLVNHFYFQCATRRPVISLIQLGGNWRNIPGSDGLPGFER
jgi:hypothetical protein